LNQELTQQLISNWNATLSVIAQLMDIPVVLVMSVNDNQIEVFSKNDDVNNPYNLKDSEHLNGSGLYCEHVVKTQKPLEVVNALQDPKWCKNPDLELDMIYYYGVPLNSGQNETFGTLCVLDQKQRKIEPKFVALLNEIKATFEMQLSLFNHQKQLLQQKSIASIDSLVWGMAHHLNTPIGTSITAVSIIKDRISFIEGSIKSKTLTMKQLTNQIYDINDSLAIADSNLKKSALLIDDYKDISTAQNEGIITEYNIADLISNCLKTKESQIAALNITIALKCDNSLIFKTCKNLFSQVLIHLINNTLVHAFDSGPDNRNIDIKVTQTQSHMLLTYTDNGCGITADIEDKIFNPFFTTNMNKGHGLGLSIVEKIINLQLNGNIALADTPHGAAFEILLPKI